MIDYSVILNTNYVTSLWVLVGNDYEGLQWLDTAPKPTQAELDAQWPTVQYNNQVLLVENTRHKDYIKISDPIFFQFQRGENTKQAWEDAVKEIQDANPYPPSPSS
jgi:hypothetical protein